MPRRKKAGGRGSKKVMNRSKSSRGPPTGASVYNGPVFTRADMNQNDSIVRVLAAGGTFTSSPGGVIAGNFTNDPASSPDFSSYSTTYEECRVLAAEFEYVPVFKNFANTPGLALSQANLAYNFNRDVLSVPLNLLNVLSNPSGKLINTSTSFKIRGHMNGTPDSDWQRTASTGPTFGFQVYATGLTPTTIYGNYVMRMRVQFRSGH